VDGNAGLADALRSAGHPVDEFRVLGRGMEGTVVAIGQGLVVKLWSHRGADHLHRLRTFYDSVATSGLRLAAPRVLDVVPVGERWATVELLLTGAPLRAGMSAVESPITDDAVSCVLEVLDLLAATEPAAGLDVLPALNGQPPLGQPFAGGLADLVLRRVKASRELLLAALPDVDQSLEAVGQGLEALGPRPTALVHGDLVPANVLVAAGSPVGLLDFGFLTAVGDPAFDAAVAASVHDMYGVHGAATESVLDHAVADRFGYPPGLLDLYRAAYALATATVFSADGSDGHFAWCVALLRRPRVRTALGL